MEQSALQRLKDKFLSIGLGRKPTDHQESRFYSNSEIVSLRLQLKAGNQEAREAVRKCGAKLHPKIAALAK